MDKRRIRRIISLAVAMTMALSVVASAVEAAVATWLSPLPGQKLSTRQIEVAVGYNTHSSINVTRLELWVDGKLCDRKALVRPESRGVCSFWWDTARYSDGPHNLLVKVYSGDDLLSSVSSTGTVGDYRYDLRPPTVSFANIKNGDVLKGISTLKLNAKDDSGDPPLVSLLVDKSLKLIKNRPPYTYDLDTTSYSDGSHELQTYAYDGAGNKSDPSVVKVAFKNGMEKPVVTSVSVKSHPNPEVFDESPVEAVPSISGSAVSSTTKTSAARSDSDSAGRISVATPIAASISMPKAPVGHSVAPIARLPQNPRPVASFKTDAAVKPMISTQPSKEAKVAPALEPERFSIPAVVASPNQSSSSPVMTLRTDKVEPAAESSFSKPVEPEQLAQAKSAQPTQMAMAPTASLRSSDLGAYLSVGASAAGNILASPVSSSAQRVVASVPANMLRSERIEQIAARGLPQVPASKSPVMTNQKPAKMACAPFVNDVNAKAASNRALSCPPVIKKDTRAKLEKKTAPASGKVKLRDLYNDLNGFLFWDSDTRTVTAISNNMRIDLTIGSNIALVNGHKMILNQVPSLIDGRTVIDISVYHQAKAFLETQVSRQAKK